jgi:HSP20 family molecular chaperone IbpA
VNLDQDLQTIHGEKKGHHEEQNKQLVRNERVAYDRIYDGFQLPAASLVSSLHS